MFILKFVLFLLVFFSFQGAATAETESAKQKMTYEQRVAHMKVKAKFCTSEAGILDTRKTDFVSECSHVCGSMDQIMAQVMHSKIPPGKVEATVARALERCESAYNQVVALVKEKRAALPASVSQQLGLENVRVGNEIDKEYNNCVQYSKLYSDEECYCIAEVLVGRAKLNGSPGRVNAAFARSIKECRGKF